MTWPAPCLPTSATTLDPGPSSCGIVTLLGPLVPSTSASRQRTCTVGPVCECLEECLMQSYSTQWFLLSYRDMEQNSITANGTATHSTASH
mmetsp:Transcript_106052/g.182973  ORF Transcript_106052/g.182973 Transcript_106052/m.182973 type:complete len:91 (-) Transcript_106052:273-545(-)